MTSNNDNKYIHIFCLKTIICITYYITHSVNCSSQGTVPSVRAETPQLQRTGPPTEGSSVLRTEPWRMAYGVDAPAANDVLRKQ